MRTLVFIFLTAAAMAAANSGSKYTTKYDNTDLDEIINNARLFEAYYKCLMDQGKCTPEGLELKSHIKEALEEKCDKCTDAQKEGIRKIIKHLINNKKEWWNSLCDKYDPDRKYAHRYEEELKSVS